MQDIILNDIIFENPLNPKLNQSHTNLYFSTQQWKIPD